MKSLNTFADHAPKPEWITDFFAVGTEYLVNNTLGPMQITKYKRFLSDAGLIDKKKTTAFYESTGFRKLSELGCSGFMKS